MERHRQIEEERSFRVYITESLREYAQGRYLTQSWLELMEPKQDFDAEAVVERIIEHAGEVSK